ncbi:MAG: tetratricopeptide repeat protein, partial [Ginsengibacter sp.]
ARLHRNDNDANKYLEEANNGDAYLVFPFRSESAEVMNWASEKKPEWKSRYYLALIDVFHDQEAKALKLMEEGTVPENFAPYFVLRARLRDSADVQNIQSDLSKAQEIDKNDWRYRKYLAQFLLTQKKYKEALEIIEPYYKKDKRNYMAGLLYARCLMLNENYEGAEKIFDDINILPYEGAQEAHKYYKQTKLNIALKFLRKHNYKMALQKVNEAKEWPERLGAGAPYPDMIDNSLEDEIEKLIYQTKQGQKLSEGVIEGYVKRVNGNS